MRKLALMLAAVSFAGGLALAQSSGSGAQAAGKTHDVKAEVVAADATAHTLTIKDEKGGTKTVPVDPGAVETLKTLKAGEKVTVTCRDNEKGEHVAVSRITIERKPSA